VHIADECSAAGFVINVLENENARPWRVLDSAPKIAAIVVEPADGWIAAAQTPG
jgi:hypothetical protein